MKQVRKIFALVLVLAMVFTMGITAFAATGSNIVVSGAKAGETYSLYKLFDANQSADATKIIYTISKDSPWKSLVENYKYNGKAAFSLVATSPAADTFTVVPDASFDTTAAADFSAYLKKNIGAIAAAQTITATADGTVEFKNLDIGYYFVTTSVGALCAIDTNNQTVSISEKNSYPSIEKKILVGDTVVDEATASISDTITYKITVTDGTGTDKKIVVHDKMEAGLTLNKESFKIQVAGLDVASANYTIKTGDELTNGCTFEIEFAPSYIASLDVNAKILITFDATLNEDAEIFADTNDNTTWLTYGNVYTSETDTVKVKTYKLDIVKTTSTGAFLTGAKFRLYDALTGGNEITLIKIGNYYRPVVSEDIHRPTYNQDAGAEMAVDANGLISIVGLGAGTYYLEETVAPAGHNPLTARMPITISTANLSYDDGNANGIYDSGEGGVQVINNQGVELPATGGIGTTLFITLGILAVLGAGIFLVVNKRMSKEAL